MSHCQKFYQTKPPFSLNVPEWRNWRPWFSRHFSCFGSHIRYKIYSTSESETSVPSSSSSFTSARAACLLLTLRVSRAGSKIASFRSLGPARPSSPWFQFPITVKDKKEVKLFAVIVVCCCCCCCPLLLSVVCQVVCLDSSQFLGQFRFGWAWRQFQWDGCSSSFSHLSQKQPHALSLQLWRLSLPT